MRSTLAAVLAALLGGACVDPDLVEDAKDAAPSTPADAAAEADGGAPPGPDAEVDAGAPDAGDAPDAEVDAGAPDAALPPSRPAYVVAASYGDSVLTVLSLDPATGALRAVPGSPFPAPGRPWMPAVAPRTARVFAASETAVLGFSMHGRTGLLTPLAGSPGPVARGAYGLAVHPGEALVFVNEPGVASTVAVLAIDPLLGGLVEVEGSPFPARGALSHVVVDPTGRFLYVASASDDGVLGYAIEPGTGALAPVPGEFFPVGPRGAPFAANPQQLAVSADGAHLFVANVAANTVTVFEVDPLDGALAEAPGSPYPTPPGLCGVAADPLGRWLFVATSTAVLGFSVDAAGQLAPVPGSPLALGRSYTCGLDVHPGGGRLVVVEGGDAEVGIDGTIRVLAIDAATGALSPMPGATASAGRDAALVRVVELGEDDGLRWSLAEDFAAAPAQRNPQPDRLGNADVWSFLSAPVDGLADLSRRARLADFQVVDTNRQQWGNGANPFSIPLVASVGGPPVARATLLHPGLAGSAEALAVVRFTSPVAGRLRVGARLRDGDVACASACDGVSAHLRHRGLEVAAEVMADAGEVVLGPVDLEVQPGDAIELAVGPLASQDNDSTLVAFELVPAP